MGCNISTTGKPPANAKENKPGKQDKQDGEVVDIDTTDPELNKAATKIQAQFRGHLARKAMKDGNS